MPRMKTGEVAVAFARIRTEMTMTENPDLVLLVDALQSHMDHATVEDSFTVLVKEVSEKLGEQSLLIREQRAFIAAQADLLVRATNAITRLTETQMKAAELEERRQEAQEAEKEHERSLEALKQQHVQAIQTTRVEKILVPAVVALIAFLSGTFGSTLIEVLFGKHSG